MVEAIRYEDIIGDHTDPAVYLNDTVIGGERKGRGLIPRNYTTHPVGCYARGTPPDFDLIPPGEYSERIKDMVATQSQLSDIRMKGMFGAMMPSRDQNGKGFCWAHSSTSALLLVRARDGQPYVDLSAYAIACIIKNYRDEGGWGAESTDWIIENGCPSSQFWAQQSMSRSNDTPAMRANAALHKVTETWMEVAAQYDRKLTLAQEATCLLSRIPVVKDENWWSHSICGADLVDGASQRWHTRMPTGKLATLQEFEKIWGMNDPITAGFGVRIWNSWGESYGVNGMGVLTGSKAVSDGACALRVATAADV